MIFKTAEQIKDKKTGEITDVVKPFWKANEIQARTNKHYDTQGLNKDLTALARVAQINRQLARGDIDAAEAAQRRRIATENCTDAVVELGKSESTNIDHARKYNKEQRARIDANEKAAKSFKGFFKSMKATGLNLGVDLAIGLAVEGAFKLFSAINDYLKITGAKKIEAMETAVNDYNSAIDESKSNIDTIKSMSSEFATLADGVDDAGRNVGLSADQFDRYNQIVSELVKLNPSLIQGYTAEGNAIIKRNNAIQDSIDLQKAAANKATREYLDKGGDVVLGVRENQKQAKSDAKKAIQKTVNENAKAFKNLNHSTLSWTGKGFKGDYMMKNNAPIQKAINKYLGEEVDLQNLSIAQISKIAQKRDEILASAKYQYNADDKSYKAYEKYLDTVVSGNAEIEASSQEMAQWLQTKMLSSKDAGGEGKTIPEEFAEGYSNALQKIAKSGNEDDMIKKSTKLADEINKINSNGALSKYTSDIEAAQKVFNNSNKDDAAIQKYNDAIADNVTGIRALADTYAKSTPQLKEILNEFAEAQEDYANRDNLDIGDVFNTAASEIDSARSVKEKFDAAMANGDYNTAIDGFKEIYKVMYDGENNAGNGSLAWWEGAEMMLGSSKLQELGYDFDKVNAAVKKLKPTMDSSAAATDKFFDKLWSVDGEGVKKVNDTTKEIKDEFGDTIATIKNVDGAISFDIPNENLSEVAAKLGVSKDYLVAMIDSARQFANVHWDNLDDVSKAIENMDTTFNKGEGKDKKSFQFYDAVQKEAAAAGLKGKEFANRVKGLKDKGVTLINKDANAKTLMKQFSDMSSLIGTFQKGGKGKNNWEGVLNADAFVAQMRSMGATAEETITIMKRLKKSGNIEIEGLEDDEKVADYVGDTYGKLETIELETNVDETASSMDRLVEAMNRLLIANGVLPEINIDSNIKEVASDLYTLNQDWSNLDKKERKQKLSGIKEKIDEQEEELASQREWFENNSQNLSEDQQKSYKADLDAAEAQVQAVKDVYDALDKGKQLKNFNLDVFDDLKDGKLENFTFNAETGEFEKKAEKVKKEAEEIDGQKATVEVSVEEKERRKKVRKEARNGVNKSTKSVNGLKEELSEKDPSNMTASEREQYVVEVKTKVKGERDKLENLEQTVNTLPEDKHVKLTTDIDANKKELDGIEKNLEKFEKYGTKDIAGLPEKVVANADAKIQESGTKVEDFFNGFNMDDETKTIAINAVTADAEENTNRYQGLLDALPPNVRTLVETMASGALGEIEIVDGQLTFLGEKETNPAIGVDTGYSLEDINEITGGLNEVDGTSATGKVNVENAEQSKTQVQDTQDSVESFDGTKAQGSVAVTMQESLPDKIQRVNGAIGELDGASATASADMQDNASGKADKAKKKVEALNKSSAHPTATLRDNASGPLNSIDSTLNSLDGKSASASVSIAVAGVSAAANALSIVNRLMGLGGVVAEGTPNRRTGKASIPSMAKGGKVGPNGNGGLTLTGELGPELVWIPSESQSFIVGALGPEVVRLPKEAVVYPADETKRILAGEDGRKQFGSMAEGKWTGSSSGKKKKKKTTSVKSGNNNTTGKSGGNDVTPKTDPKENKKTKEIYDWIEVKLDRIQRKIDNWNKKAGQTNQFFEKGKDNRFQAYNKEYAKTKREISLQEKGQKRYNKQANKIKLSKKWKKRVDNGEININSVKDEKLKEKIKNYKEWREKALDCRDAIVDLKGRLAEIQKEKFDLITVKFEGKLAEKDFKANMIEEKISQAENKGRIVSTKYYDNLKGVENQKISTLQEERAKLQKQFDAAMKTGKIKKGSEMWQEMKNEIDGVTLSIEESRTAITEYDKAIREINYEIFDHLQERISKITQEGDFLIELMSNKKLYDDKGQLTDQGMATMGMHGVNYNVYMGQADKYANELKTAQADLDADPYNEDIRARRDELLEKQRESILAAEKEKDAIKDMVEEGINLELESLDELIDKYKEALDSQKD